MPSQWVKPVVIVSPERYSDDGTFCWAKKTLYGKGLLFYGRRNLLAFVASF